MANPTTLIIWKQARAHLNDVGNTKYTNQVLLPFTQDAVWELEDAILENGGEVLGENSSALSVPVNTLEIRYSGTTPTLPSDLIEPRDVFEKVSGADVSTYVRIGPVRVLPIRPQGPTLDEYLWEEQVLKFVGATTVRDIKILYLKGFPMLTDPADPAQEIPYNEAGPFLSFKTSALAAATIAQDYNRAQILHQQAEVALARTLNLRARSQQDLPARRRTWRRPSRRFGFRSISRIR